MRLLYSLNHSINNFDHLGYTVNIYKYDKHLAGAVNDSRGKLTYKYFLPWLEQHMMPTEQKLQGNRISLHLISVFSPKMILKTCMKMYQFNLILVFIQFSKNIEIKYTCL